MTPRLRALFLVAMFALGAVAPPAMAQDAPTRIFVHPIYGFSVEFDWSWEAIPLTPYFGSGGLSLASGQRRISIDGYSLMSTDPQTCIARYADGMRAQTWVTSMTDAHPATVAALEGARPASAFAIYDVVQSNGRRGLHIVECRFFEHSLGMAQFVYTSPYTDVDEEVAIARRVFDTARSYLPWTAIDAATPAALEADFTARLEVVDAYWARVFQERGWGTYTPPADLVVFDAAFTGPCGFIAATDSTHYCSGDTIIRVNYDLAIGSIGLHGDIGAFGLIAHEVGHHVQHERNVPFCERAPCGTRGVPNPDYEYQVSCLVGAFASGSGVADLDGPLALRTFTDQLIFMEEEAIHGDNGENVRWFMAGYVDGPDACFVFPLAAD